MAKFDKIVNELLKAKTENLRFSEVLRKIQTSGNNFDPTAQWMQRWAAWALEPDKWPKPEDKPQ